MASHQQHIIDKLDVFKIQGRDKRGHNILRIIGKFFPARIVSVDVLKKYLEEKIYPRENLEAVYFVHPGLQARLFLATFGRLMFSGGFYGKLRYINRLDFLWDQVRRYEIEIPDFVYDHDEDLEYRPMMDHGLESDHPRVYGAPAVDSYVPMYSMRCIS
ncbi:hypothetical protein F0562_003990 [Nyssa sinensis]|uniref:CRAL-TRIO domain-containing protein n=1 Tax=Nyssa sinensis TaxID=561372 RepID=A0A5J5C242_9ASTE|nr:hypothetical protein F0562_003990 [Nyssa sinensis]